MPSDTRRLARSAWTDIRFVIGIALVLASMAGVWAVVAVSRATAPVYAAAATIVPGQAVDADDLTVIEVALGTASEMYLGADDLGPGVVATRTVSAGELVPRDALVPERTAQTTVVVLDTTTSIPESVVAGSVVEVWAAPRLDQTRFDAPRILVADATVVRVDRDTSPLAAGAASVELVVARADVSATLGAVADGAAISIVPGGAGQ